MQCDRKTAGRQRTQQTQLDHEAALHRAQQMAKLAHVITGAAGEFLEWSETLPGMIGRDAAAMPRSTRAWLELLHPEDRERFRRIAIRAGKTGTAVVFEYRLQLMPGEWLHIRQVTEALDSEQDPKAGRCWFNTLQDVTAEKQAAQTLQASEERYRTTFEQAAVGIVHSSLEGEVQLVNQTFCTMTGYSRAEALQYNIRDVTHPQDMGPSTEGRMKIVEGSGTPYQRELRLLSKDGSYLWVSVTTSLVRGADGKPLHFVSVLSDISDRKRVEEEVNRFRAAMDVSVESIFLTDPKTMHFLYVNDTACRKLGYTREQLLQKAPFELIGKTREQLSSEDDEVIAAGERGTRTETPYVRSDGSEGWTELYRRALCAESGMVIVTIARDITERRAQQQKIERLSRVHAVLSGINAAIVRIRDREELFRESCRIAHKAGGFDVVWIGLIDQRMTAVEPVAWDGAESSVLSLKQARSSLNDNDGQAGQGLLAEAMRTRKPAVTNDALNDSRVLLKQTMAELGINSAAFLPLAVGDRVAGVMAMYSPLRGHFDDAEVKLLSDLAADISFALEHLEKSERVAYLALYDELTGLANRRLLAERLEQFVHAAGRAQDKLAVALLDIERLRSVNESLGRRAGDALLRQVAERLTQAAGAGAVARIALDHFVVVMPTIKDAAEAERMIAAIARACFAEPFAVEGTELKVGVKTGLAVFPNDGIDTETLLVNSEAALRRAKATGERRVFYMPGLTEPTGARLTLAKFIPLMEETGMILDVGAWVLQRASLDRRRWADQGFGLLRVAVNVSAIQLRQRNFVHSVEQAIVNDVTPIGIDLEMTESLVMEDVEENIRKLKEVLALGVQVAIDDFGTGYSSLGYLAKLPVQALKIDRSFISAMLNDPAAMTIILTINSLAHTLGLKVIAEGVEEEEQAKYLRLLRCDQIQGYLVSQPLPFDEITRFLRASQVGGNVQW
jgi:PAS domain S-box-containing protein/diguanylate cyclase (GGDEF)-like protein